MTKHLTTLEPCDLATVTGGIAPPVAPPVQPRVQQLLPQVPRPAPVPFPNNERGPGSTPSLIPPGSPHVNHINH